jgi:murein tripeptide amidase MpaA
MNRTLLFCIIFCSFLLPLNLLAQDQQEKILNSVFKERGEVCFRFSVNSRSEINELTRIISIDNVKGNEVTAYANRDEFKKFLDKKYTYTILPPPSTLLKESELNMGGVQTDAKGRTVWNFYPTYQQYLDFMAGFATTYPTICRVDTIGTSVQGRLLIAVKISDSVQFERGKPQFLYTSSIHGDETTGYVLMMHLIDYLLSNYGTDQRITNMVNNTEIFINPLANPDGTYHGGNNTVYGAQRYNSLNIDLNRNYPDPAAGPHPDGNAWQKETLAFMDFADSSHFVMSMNFHGGAEVFNYPWDTWAKFHADNDWFDFLGREYADTVHLYGPASYFTFMDNGVTNGYAWYSITGGRQDYMTYFQHGREVTLEISDVKTLSASQLINFWNYNYRSFLNYIEQVNYGINGQVTDTLTGQPLKVKVNILLHDFDNSFIYSSLPTGWYFRPIDEGSYNLTFSAQGYFTKTIQNVNVSRWNTTRLDVQMVPLTIGGTDNLAPPGLSLFPNPSSGKTRVILPESGSFLSNIEVFNILGQSVFVTQMKSNDQHQLEIDLSSMKKGIYFIRLKQDLNVYEGKLILK